MATTASFDILSFDHNSVRIEVTTDSNFTKYRIFLRTGRESDGTGETIRDRITTVSSSTLSFEQNITFPYPDEWYTINVASASDDELSFDWIGAQEFRADEEPYEPRPDDFSWVTAKVSGNNFNLSAYEWNLFTSRINEFRAYQGLSNYSFSTAYSGNDFTAAMYNQARTAISALSGSGSRSPSVFVGGTVYASYLNWIVADLNDTP